MNGTRAAQQRVGCRRSPGSAASLADPPPPAGDRGGGAGARGPAARAKHRGGHAPGAARNRRVRRSDGAAARSTSVRLPRLLSLPLLPLLPLFGSLALAAAPIPARADAGSTIRHATAIREAPRYPAGFPHFDHVNPNAPKGGTVRRAAVGATFDSLNPFIVKGDAAAGIGLLFDTLTEDSPDEATAAYGLVAEWIEVADDESWTTFWLRPEARFQDGSPVTAADVAFSFDVLKAKGHPFYRAYYGSVREAEPVAGETPSGPRAGVKFHFEEGRNHELPSILGQLPVLSKADWEGRDFARTTLDPPLGSGPYVVEPGSVEPGRSIVYRRAPDYWARDLPVMVGRHNFDRIRYDYYRDATVAVEALKAGEYDFRRENGSKRWATGYSGPALEAGLLRRELLPNSLPQGMQAFVFNTRRAKFADPRVREALGHAFDFEWTNRQLFYGQYRRSTSFFSNSELAASGPPSAAELTILAPYRGRVPERVFTTAYEPPRSDGRGGFRGSLRRALALLREAGWTVRDGRLVDAASGAAMELEMLLVNPDFERVVLPFGKNLERLGVRMTVRTVDPAQYTRRVTDFDFDVIVGSFGITLSPGNEQRDYWGSAAAGLPGSRNLAGARDPVVDALVEQVIAAPDRKSLIDRSRALDRVLLFSHYVIPNWHLAAWRVAYWDVFGRPEAPRPRYRLGFDTWWIDEAKAERVRRWRGERTQDR